MTLSWWQRWWRRHFGKRLVAPYANFSRNVHPAPNGVEILTVAIPVRTSLLRLTAPEAAAEQIATAAYNKAYGAALARSKNGPNRGTLTLPGWSNN